MNEFHGVICRQVETLLGVIRQKQETRCREITATAEQQAAQAIARGRRKLFERRRQAVMAERQRRRQELMIAGRRIESKARRRTFAQYERVLEMAWPRLIAALDERWADPDSRRDWCKMIVAEAAALLAPETWVIEHPEDWTAGDRDSIESMLEELGIEAPAYQPAPCIRAGLRINAGSACLDGTPKGLLADSRAVESQILACWEATRDTEHRHG